MEQSRLATGRSRSRTTPSPLRWPRTEQTGGSRFETVARQYGLGFIPAQDEHYDFMVPKARLERPAVQRFREVLADPSIRETLAALGFQV
jgi:PBP superfamily domain